MNLMALYIYRLTQLVISMMGIVFSVWVLRDALADRRWIRESGRNGIFLLLVKERLFLKLIILFAQLIPFVFGLMSVVAPAPRVYTWRVYFTLTLFLLLTGLLTAASCVIKYYRSKTVSYHKGDA